MTNFDLDPAYLAGVMDADGSFTISKHTRPGTGNGYDFRVYVQLTWTDSPRAKAVLEAIHAQYGGNIFAHLGRYPNSRPSLKLTISARKAEPLIRDVLPHLLLKREQAALCLRAIELGRAPGLIRWHKCPEHVWSEREQLATRVRALNSKNGKGRGRYQEEAIA